MIQTDLTHHLTAIARERQADGERNRLVRELRSARRQRTGTAGLLERFRAAIQPARTDPVACCA